jgi:hypothetical protein
VLSCAGSGAGAGSVVVVLTGSAAGVGSARMGSAPAVAAKAPAIRSATTSERRARTPAPRPVCSPPVRTTLVLRHSALPCGKGPRPPRSTTWRRSCHHSTGAAGVCHATNGWLSGASPAVCGAREATSGRRAWARLTDPDGLHTPTARLPSDLRKGGAYAIVDARGPSGGADPVMTPRRPHASPPFPVGAFAR